MKIVIVRHARTHWNDAKRLQGWSDVEPYPEALDSFLKATESIPIQPDVIFTSDLKRAVMSAKALLKRYGSVPILADWRIRERYMGDWEGMKTEDIKKRYPQVHRVDFRLPKGESLLDLAERVGKFAEDVRWYAGKMGWENVLIVTHQLAMEILRRKFLGTDVDETVWDFLRSNGEWVFIEI